MAGASSDIKYGRTIHGGVTASTDVAFDERARGQGDPTFTGCVASVHVGHSFAKISQHNAGMVV